MPSPRYVLHPGYVHSADGQRHYVDAPTLRRLYGVPPGARVAIMQPGRVVEVGLDRVPVSGWGWEPDPDDIDLYPRDDGDYRLPNG